MTDLSPLDRRLLDYVPKEPATATWIWRQFTQRTDGRLSLSTRMRRHRREIAARLEDLAGDGHIRRTEIERRGVRLPAYFR